MYHQVVKQEHHIKIGRMGTKFLFSRRHILVLLCLFIHIVLSAELSEAQDTPTFPEPQRGMVFEKGTWRAPTAEESIQALMALDDNYGTIQTGESRRVSSLLYAVIQQGLQPQPRSNLDAFVGDLFQVWVSETGWRRDQAGMALSDAGAGKYHDGSPYLGVTNELIRIYESIDDYYPRFTANDILYMLSEGWGINYVWDVFNSTPKPPVCSRNSLYYLDNPCPNISPWCDAGKFLIGQPGGPDKEEWEALCKSDKESTVY